MHHFIQVLSAGIAAAVCFAAPVPASAQNNVARQVQAKVDAVAKKVTASCQPDLKRHCSDVTPGEGRILYCILAYGDKLTPKCAATMIEVGRDVASAMQEAADTADICYDDIEKLCPNVAEGQGRIAQCLVDNKVKLSKACTAQVELMQARVQKK